MERGQQFIKTLYIGVSIPLILTFQDNQKIFIENDEKENYYYFNQPLLQTAMIFLGEIICILVIHLVTKAPTMLDRSMLETVQPHNANYNDYNDWTRSHTSTWSWSSAWFILPSACDLIATTVSCALSMLAFVIISNVHLATQFRFDLYDAFCLSDDKEQYCRIFCHL